MPRLVSPCVALLAFLAALAVPALAQERPIVIGLTMAQTGLLADLGASYSRGLALWLEEANASGGSLGRRFELRIRDDKSAANGVEALYERLVTEDKVDVLLGPVGSAATLPAMAVAEQRRRMLINATGVDTALLKRGNRYTYHVPAAAQDYGTHILPLFRQSDAKRVLLFDNDDSGMGARLREDAKLLGLPLEVAGTGFVGDTLTIIEQARKRGIDAVIVTGAPGDAADVVKAMKKAAFAPRIIIASGARHPEFVRLVGQDAEYVVGVVQYSPAQRTPGNAAFVAAYRAKHKQAPDFFAACAYAAGKVLEAGLREAGTTDSEKLREALLRIRVDTPLGAHEAGKDGAQAGARPVLMQMQKGRREIVWPESAATAKPVVPYPAWSARTLLTK